MMARNPCIALGFFDGFHLGHYYLLKSAEAFSRDLSPDCEEKVIITFKEHPSSLKRPYILLPDERKSKASSLGWRVEFLPGDFKNLSPLEFVNYLRDKRPSVVVSGYDYRFGKDRKGDVDLLKKTFGESFLCVPPLNVDGIPVKSSLIKERIREGDVSYANFLLGYRFFLKGVRVSGKGKGREIGFPTINILHPHGKVRPLRGSYAAILEGVRSVAYFGVSPTVSGASFPVWEVHVLDEKMVPELSSLDEMKLELVSFIRREEKFFSVEELSKAIRNDIDQALSMFKILSSSSLEK